MQGFETTSCLLLAKVLQYLDISRMPAETTGLSVRKDECLKIRSERGLASRGQMVQAAAPCVIGDISTIERLPSILQLASPVVRTIVRHGQVPGIHNLCRRGQHKYVSDQLQI
jgi:hypothetical protein